MTTTEIYTNLPAISSPERSESAHVATILMFVLVFVAGIVLSVLMFGLPGLYIPAVAIVPVMFVVLIMITLG